MSDAQIANVVDMSCIRSLIPLRFGLTSAFVTGPVAILFRILWRWNQLLGFVPYAEDLGIATPLLDIDGATFSREDLAGLRGQLVKQAKAEDFVTDATAALTLTDAGALTVRAVITLQDAGDYSLEVQAAGAINQLGGFHFPDSAIAATIAFIKANF